METGDEGVFNEAIEEDARNAREEPFRKIDLADVDRALDDLGRTADQTVAKLRNAERVCAIVADALRRQMAFWKDQVTVTMNRREVEEMEVMLRSIGGAETPAVEAAKPTPYSPLEVAVAMSLYSYNVSPYERVMAVHRHFKGKCMEPEDLFEILHGYRLAFAATELPAQSAEVYVQHALARYGEEARARVAANLGRMPT